jgi:hypothetical protein
MTDARTAPWSAQTLRREDLLSLEAYDAVRADFRARAIAHKRLRTLVLDTHLRLQFEDRLTVQYQVQEMLRIERIFAAGEVQAELEAYAGLLPGGRDLRATLLIGIADAAQRARSLAAWSGIEHALYAEVDGAGRAITHADEDLPRSETRKTSAVHFLRFGFSDAQIAALRAGAALTFGIDDARLPLRVQALSTLREALLRDFAAAD